MFKPEVIGNSIPNNFSDYPAPVSIFLDSFSFQDATEGNTKIFLQLEPQEFCRTRKTLIEKQESFDLILAWDEKTLRHCRNAVLFPFGTTWLNKTAMKFNKKNNISFITSNKNMGLRFDGHAMRHKIWKFLQSYANPRFDIIKHMSPPFIPDKAFLFESSKFSIIVESVKRNNYFSEKLIDCLITRTIPIYRGCGNIGRFFNEKGFLKFDDIRDLRNILNGLQESRYDELIDYARENEQIAEGYADIWKRVDSVVMDYLSRKAQ